MNFVKTFAMGLMVVTLMSMPSVASAQQSPLLMFSDAEKEAIGKHFGIDIPTTSEAPEWAKKDDDDDDDKDDKDKKKNKNKNKKKGNDKDKDKSKGKSKDLPPGLAKRGGDLPPGLQKQLEKNGRLPGGLDKRDLPDDLISKLPKRPDDQDIKIIDGDVVLLDKTTGIILDVINDVLKQSSPQAGDGPPPQDAPNEGGLQSILKSIFGN